MYGCRTYHSDKARQVERTAVRMARWEVRMYRWERVRTDGKAGMLRVTREIEERWEVETIQITKRLFTQFKSVSTITLVSSKLRFYQHIFI